MSYATLTRPMRTNDPAQSRAVYDVLGNIRSGAAGSASCTPKMPRLSADTSELEAEIDRLCYNLYGLTDEEIAVVGTA